MDGITDLSHREFMYPKGDMRRIWHIIGAVECLERATLTTIVQATGIPKASVDDTLKKIMYEQIPGFMLIKDGPVYTITSWGILKKKELKDFYKTLERSD